MAQFRVNPQRFDPYKNFKFRVKWDGSYVAGMSKVGSLKRTTEVVKHREGGDPSSSRKSPARTEYEPITLERGRLSSSDGAVWLAIGPIGWVGVLVGLPIWTALTSVLLVRPARAPAGAVRYGAIA